MGKRAKRQAAPTRRAVKRRAAELPPELQEAEILGGSSDAGGWDSEEEEPTGEVKELLRRVEAAKEEGKAKAKGKAEGKAKGKVKGKAKGKAKAEAKEGRRDGQIYLAELPYSLNAEVLSLWRWVSKLCSLRKSDFEKFGEISRFFFHKDAEGEFQGTACLFYKDPEVADKVVLLDGIVPCLSDVGSAAAQEYKGRALRVRRRQPRARKKGRLSGRLARAEVCGLLGHQHPVGAGALLDRQGDAGGADAATGGDEGEQGKRCPHAGVESLRRACATSTTSSTITTPSSTP